MTDGRAGLGKDGLNFRQCPTDASRQADPRAENAPPAWGGAHPDLRPRRDRADRKPMRPHGHSPSCPSPYLAPRANRGHWPQTPPNQSAPRPGQATGSRVGRTTRECVRTRGHEQPAPNPIPKRLDLRSVHCAPPTQALRQGVPVGVFKLTWRPITGIDPGRRAEAPRPMPRSPHPPARVRREMAMSPDRAGRRRATAGATNRSPRDEISIFPLGFKLESRQIWSFDQ